MGLLLSAAVGTDVKFKFPTQSMDVTSLRNWWDSPQNDVFAHRANYFNYTLANDVSELARNIERRKSFWERTWMGALGNITGKTVVDYGVGAGHLGLVLLRDKGIARYVAVDISRSSLEATRTTIAGAGLPLSRVETHLVPVEFRALNAEIFISLAVIQHFPDAAFVRSFFANLDRSGISVLILQTRATASPQQRETHGGTANAIYGTRLSTARVAELLPSYCLVQHSAISPKTFYQHLHLIKKLGTFKCGV